MSIIIIGADRDLPPPPLEPASERLHIVSLLFENGRTALVTIRDGEAPCVRVEGLNHVQKVCLESHDIRAIWTEKRAA